MRINRLCPALGVELIDLDVSRPICDDRFAEIHGALCNHDDVIVLRDQQLTADQHVSFRSRPAMVSLLYAIEIPPLGGDTLFCNMYAAYDALSPAMKQFLGGLRVHRDFAVNTSIGFSREVIDEQVLDGANAAMHPVVRTHGDTERKCLFVNPGNTSYLEGLEPRESVKLLEFLYGHCTQPEFIYRHRWSSNDLIVWDNRCIMHYAIIDYDGDRYLHRTTVIGEWPVWRTTDRRIPCPSMQWLVSYPQSRNPPPRPSRAKRKSPRLCG